MKTVGAFVAISGALSASVAATPTSTVTKRAVTPISVKGNAFFAGDTRFYIRGVDYQPGGSSGKKDPIADVTSCKRDVENFKALGINTVRVYTVDNTANHDECMSALADAGIYLALDVNTPDYSIRRDLPAPSYNKVYLQSIFATIDAFQKYDNTLLFFSGNEVINDDATTSAAPFVKATTRDMKSYINAMGYRKIPVGYSAADVDSNRLQMAQYMNCGDDAIRSDFFAFNDYSWCDPSDFTTSGWDQKVQKFKDYSIPLFLSEFGCNTNKRDFGEVKSLYSTDMSAVYSGGLVYEYSQENKFGLVTISGNSVSKLPDFDVLKAAYAGQKDPSGDGGYKSNGAASECPTESKTWNVSIAADQLPVLPDGVADLMKKGVGAGAGPGLQGNSQSSGSDNVQLGPAAEGAVTTGSTTGSAGAKTSKGAAASIRMGEASLAPYVCGLVLIISTLCGAALI